MIEKENEGDYLSKITQLSSPRCFIKSAMLTVSCRKDSYIGTAHFSLYIRPWCLLMNPNFVALTQNFLFIHICDSGVTLPSLDRVHQLGLQSAAKIRGKSCICFNNNFGKTIANIHGKRDLSLNAIQCEIGVCE